MLIDYDTQVSLLIQKLFASEICILFFCLKMCFTYFRGTQMRGNQIKSIMIHYFCRYMNAFIEDAKLVTPEGRKKDFKQFFVKGEQIRFVQIPPDVSFFKLDIL